jgi:serine/threonine protein kinase
LFGAKIYTPAIDVWSAGCILAELFTGTALFDGKSDIDQLTKITFTLGNIDVKRWPGDLPLALQTLCLAFLWRCCLCLIWVCFLFVTRLLGVDELDGYTEFEPVGARKVPFAHAFARKTRCFPSLIEV